MNVLAIETSTDKASVALSLNGTMHCLEQDNIRQHAQRLLPMIQELLDQSHATWRDLEGIVFGAGPGSFTGLRIACSIAQALAYAHDLPVYPVGSLDAIVYQVHERASETLSNYGVLAVLDARMQEMYWAYYPPGETLPLHAVQVSKSSAIMLPDDQEIILAGWGWEAYQAEWPEAVKMAIIDHYSIAPDAQSLIHLVNRGQVNAITAAQALPIYVRNQVTHVKRGSHG